MVSGESTIPELHERAMQLCEDLYGASYGRHGTTHHRLRVAADLVRAAHVALSPEGTGLFPPEQWEKPQVEMHFGTSPVALNPRIRRQAPGKRKRPRCARSHRSRLCEAQTLARA